MNKKTIRIAGWALGLSMAVASVGIAVGAFHPVSNEPLMVKAEGTASVTAAFTDFGLSGSSGPGSESKTGYGLAISTGTSSNGVAKNGTIKNTSEFPGSITNVTVEDAATSSSKTDGTFEVFVGTSSSAITTSMGETTGLSSSAQDCSIDITGDYTFFQITVGSARTLKFSNIIVTYSTAVTSFKVTYNGNGNTGGSVPTDSTKYKTDGSGTCTVADNTGSLTKTHYTFSGWNTSADGNGTDRAVGSTFSVTENVTLYAKWISSEVWLSTSSGSVNKGNDLDISEYVKGATGTVTYNSTDTSKATVTSAGVIHGVAAGSTTIIVSDSGTSTNVSFSVTVVDFTPTEGVDDGGKYILTATDSSSNKHYFTGSISSGKGATSTTNASGAVLTFSLVGNGKYSIRNSSSKYIAIGTSSTSMSWSDEATTLAVTKSEGTYMITNESSGRSLCWYASNSDIRTYTSGTYLSLTEFDATEYGKEFTGYYTAGCKAAGGYASADMHWSDAAARFAMLPSAQQTSFSTAAANESGTAIEQAAARYDYIVGKYGTSTFSDFASRSPSGIGGTASVFVPNANGEASMPLVILFIGAGIAVAGGFWFISLKHRKEE